jgi:starch-binding outer membrane protein, SusD/RagB family
MKHIIRRYLYLLPLLCLGTGCESFLDEKPDRQQVVPATLPDLQALLDRYNIINGNDPGAGISSADNYYLTDKDLASVTNEEDRRLYTWEKDNLFVSGSNDWSDTYRPVYTANTALEQMRAIPLTPANQTTWNNVRGQALFLRAKAFFYAAVVWAPAYREGTAARALGIPLRLTADFNEKSTRATLQQTFDRIGRDLQEAVRLLPDTPLHPNRPARAAAYALLARMYLYQHRYPLVEAYADSALRLHSHLLDFNTLSTTAKFPVPQANREVLYRSFAPMPSLLNPDLAKVDSVLYQSYGPDDLRRAVFFRSNGNGTFSFKGSFEGNYSLFTGIATGEVLLMRAEARARQDKAEQAMEDLNALLTARWKSGTFVPFTAATRQEALDLILRERRKELLLRGLRWLDLKRLNAEGAGITLTRRLHGKTYSLPPNDPRYALPLPEDVIQLSGMTQNPR